MGVLVLLAARACRLRGEESNANAGQRGREEEVEEEMRIADILREDEDEQCCGDGNANKGSSKRRRKGRRRKKRASPSSRSPRCLLSRWLPSKQFLCRACGEEFEDDEMEEEEGEEAGEFAASLLSPTSAGASASADKEEEGASSLETMASFGEREIAVAGSEERNMAGTEWKPEQMCLNVGMGAGLLVLLTRSITEFNKMIELRKEMEVLLKDIKEEMPKKVATPSSSESKNNFLFCGSNSWADTEQSNGIALQDCNPCLELVEMSCDAEPGSCSKCVKAYEDTKPPMINEIEAELVSELELLQLNLDRQGSSEHLGVEFSGETTNPSERFSVSLGGHYDLKEWVEEEEEEDDDARDRYGVCPHELTRRLHELMETRQQERIAELESALELANIRLREKEMEVSLWKDTAQLVSQNKEEALFT